MSSIVQDLQSEMLSNDCNLLNALCKAHLIVTK